MYRRYIYLFIVLIILAVLTVFFISIITPDKKAEETKKRMVDFTSQGVVTYTVDGVINANQDHRAIKITVSDYSAKLEIITGYQNEILNTYKFSNNADSFRAFLAALDTMGFDNERIINDDITIEGRCPLGRRFIFTSSYIDVAPEYTWTTSCTTKDGNFAGRLNNIQQLFRLQIPGYNKLTSGVKL